MKLKVVFLSGLSKRNHVSLSGINNPAGHIGFNSPDDTAGAGKYRRAGRTVRLTWKEELRAELGELACPQRPTGAIRANQQTLCGGTI